MSTRSSPGVAISGGLRLNGWLESTGISTSHSENRNNLYKRIPFHIQFTTAIHDASVSLSTSISPVSSTTNSHSSTTPVDSGHHQQFIQPEPISRVGLYVTGTIHYGSQVETSAINESQSQSQPQPDASQSPSVVSRFTGTADPTTGAFDIVTDGPAGDHCPTVCRYVARLPQGHSNNAVSHTTSDFSDPSQASSEKKTSSSQPLLVGLWHSNNKPLASRVLGVFCISDIQTDAATVSDDPIASSPSTESVVNPSTGKPVCPYSSMMYAGFLQTGAERKDVVFNADVHETKDTSFLVQGSMYIQDPYEPPQYLVKGTWSVDHGLQLQLYHDPLDGRSSVSYKGSGQCVLDTSNGDWNALSTICNRVLIMRKSDALMDAAVDGWNSSLPRLILTATLSQPSASSSSSSDGKDSAATTSRLCLFSVTQELLARSDESFQDAASGAMPKDDFGRSHGFCVTQMNEQVQFVQISEHVHGRTAGATFSGFIDHGGLGLYTPMARLRCMPTSTEGILIAMRDDDDINGMGSYASLLPWHGLTLTGTRAEVKILSQAHKEAAAVVPTPSKGEWELCGIANDFGDSQGVLIPSKRGFKDMDNPHAVHSKPLFSMPHEYVTSCTGELWMGQWMNHYAVGEHTYRSSDRRWWRLRYNDQGQLLSHVELPESRSIELMDMVLVAITKIQTRMRDQRLEADAKLQTFEERASHSTYLAELASGSDLLVDECQEMSLPQKYILCNGFSNAVIAECGLYRGELAYLRDAQHGFGIAYKSESPATTVAGQPASLHRGPLRYEGELRLDLQHGFGHSVKIVNDNMRLTHALGQHRFNMTHGVNAMWSYLQTPLKGGLGDTSYNLQRLVMSPTVSGVASGLGFILNQTSVDTQSCSLGHLYWGSGKYPVLEGISLERLSFTTRLALWKRLGDQSIMTGPMIRLIYDEQVRLCDQGYDDERVAVKLEMFSGSVKKRVSHGRVHSTHPLLMLMCAAIEHQAKELDATTLTWLQATTRFDDKRRRFRAMPVEAASPVRMTGHTCDACGAQLSIGNHWQCSQVLCHVDFCSQCKGDSAWGRAVNGHSQFHGPLRVFDEAAWKEKETCREELKRLTEASKAVPAAVAAKAPATEQSSTHQPIGATSSSSSSWPPAASPATSSSIPAPVPLTQVNEPSLPFSLDLSFDGQREAKLLGPTLQAALNKYVRSPASSSSMSSSTPSSPSASTSTSSTGVMNALMPTLLSSKPKANNLRESLLSSDEQKAADERPSPSPSASHNPLQSDQTPTIASILTQLILLLDQSSDLLSTCDERYILAAVPSIRRDGTPVHMGSDWHQKLGSEAHPIDATFLRLQSHGASARRNFHLFLLSRVRSLVPFLTWLRDRCQLVTSGNNQHQDSSVSPLTLSISHTVVLYVVLQHYGDLLRMVKHELTVAMPLEGTLPRPIVREQQPSSPSSSSGEGTQSASAAVSQISPDPTPPATETTSAFAGLSATALLESPYWFASWVRRTSGNMMQYVLEQDAHFIEYAQTSTLPAMQLWIRMMDTKDLIVACLPLLDQQPPQ